MATLIKRIILNPSALVITMTQVDTDDDVSPIIDILALPFLPQGIMSLQITRSAGADDTVDVQWQMSNDGTTWTTALQETDVTGGISEVTLATGKIGRFVKIIAPDVGASNTIEIYGLMI